MNARDGPLPVGVVIPCRNSAAHVPRHLEALAKWIDLADEVVVVDSESTDGTVELLRAGIHHPRIRFLNHPPGLYPSWNFGIGQIRAPFTYIATMGDSITRAGLRHLVEVAERFQSDVVISPPRFVPSPGQPAVDWVWPVHHVIEWRHADHPLPLSGSQAFVVTALMLPSGLLGSSASNLYRTDLLQRRPFPAQYGHASDTAWTLVHGLDARWALTPQVVSEFLVHPNPAHADDRNRTLAETLLTLARETCRSREPGDVPPELLEWLTLTPTLWEAERVLKTERRAGARWLLSPTAWRAYAQRSHGRARLAKLRRSLEGHVKTSIPTAHRAP